MWRNGERARSLPYMWLNAETLRVTQNGSYTRNATLFLNIQLVTSSIILFGIKNKQKHEYATGMTTELCDVTIIRPQHNLSTPHNKLSAGENSNTQHLPPTPVKGAVMGGWG